MTWNDIPPELQAILLSVAGALSAVVIAYLEKLRRDLADNTQATQRASVAAVAAQEAAEAVQQATVDRLDYDRLRRIEAALLTLDECAGCRQKILELSDRRRLRPTSLPQDTP